MQYRSIAQGLKSNGLRSLAGMTYAGIFPYADRLFCILNRRGDRWQQQPSCLSRGLVWVGATWCDNRVAFFLRRASRPQLAALKNRLGHQASPCALALPDLLR